MNLSVVCQKDLEDALVHPESHENLVVRVGGFTARFIDLDKKTQQDVLTRTGTLLREKTSGIVAAVQCRETKYVRYRCAVL